MAGYICKIVIEDTHPPVWRRVLIPDRITFEELHEIIQLLFGWDDAHLHEFRIPADNISIGSEDDVWGCAYNESETLIDSFFRNYKWIRYTYDFGDDWRHRINIEKIDTDYTERSAVLMKFKGDNFEEDRGGFWEEDADCRRAFDRGYVERQLKHMVFPRHEELQESKLLKESMGQLAEMIKKLLDLKPEVLQSKLAQVVEDFRGEASPMAQKVDAWVSFVEEEAEDTLKIVLPEKSQKELLMDIGEKEAADYYKYLRIPRNGILSHEELVSAVAETLRKHPEYLCYIFDEAEYQDLVEWIQHPQKSISKKAESENMLIKALGMGLADFVRKESCGELSFASDISQFIGVVDIKAKKKTYKMLDKFDARMGKLIQVYGLIELESLYEIYKNLYEKNLEKEAFFRFIYWHARFNNLVNTVYHLDGTCYVAMKELDVESIFEKTSDYAENLMYAVYSKREIDDKGADLSNRSEWVEILYTILYYKLQMNPYEAQNSLFECISVIMNGDTLNQVIGMLEEQSEKVWSLEVAVEIWMSISGLMLELELPMLKGRSRQQYAKEQKCSAWSVGMAAEQDNIINTTKCRMYQFSAEIQGWMYEARNSSSEERIQQLFDYKEQNHICSEEYLYLLVDTCIIFGRTKEAEKLIVQLKNSSPVGKKAAKHLNERLQERYEIVDAGDDWIEADGWNWMTQEEVRQPYVRNTPKIGRNDPCPCGSGKKYKRCCGRIVDEQG